MGTVGSRSCWRTTAAPTVAGLARLALSTAVGEGACFPPEPSIPSSRHPGSWHGCQCVPVGGGLGMLGQVKVTVPPGCHRGV